MSDPQQAGVVDALSDTVEVSALLTHDLNHVWHVLTTNEGAAAVLGEGATLGGKGEPWRAADGTHGVWRTYHPLEQVRVSWHADDERDLDPAVPIASLSLGSACEFQFRPRTPGKEPGTVAMLLEAGSLLTMHAPTNSRFQHCLPRRTGRAACDIGPRWNLTFRRMICRK